MPNWILGWHGMHDQTINLPDGSTHPYGSYKIPCCKACNTAMGKRFENPISHLFKTSITPVLNRPHATATLKTIFQWLSLIFVKVHLVDRKLYARGEASFDWTDIHHPYSVARAFAGGLELDDRVIGSMWLLRLPDDGLTEPFDYADITSCQTLLLRVGSNAIVCVLDDCCAALGAVRLPRINWLPGKINLQLREVAARAAYANALLRERPTFHTRLRDGRFVIDVDLPPRPVFHEHDPELYGSILYHLYRQPLQLDAREDADAVKRAVLEGRLSFLENDDTQGVAP